MERLAHMSLISFQLLLFFTAVAGDSKFGPVTHCPPPLPLHESRENADVQERKERDQRIFLLAWLHSHLNAPGTGEEERRDHLLFMDLFPRSSFIATWSFVLF